MFCPKCGKQIIDGAKFCSKCGASLGDAEKSTGKKASVDEDSTEVLFEDTTTDKQSFSPLPEFKTEEPNFEISPPKKKSGLGGKIAALVIMIVIILGLAGVLGYFFLFGGQKTNKTKEFMGYLQLAEESLDKEDYEGAIGYYKAALEVNPKEEEVYRDLAKVYHDQNKLKQAIKTLETGVDITSSQDLSDVLKKYKEEQEKGESDKGISDESSEESDEKKGNDDKKKSDKDNDDDDDSNKPYTGERKSIDIEVRQVDNSKFPEVALYTSITDDNGEVVKNLKKKDFDIQEIDKDGNVIDASIEDMYQVMNEDKISIELVMDASGSMSDYNKMQQAKNAATALVSEMSKRAGDQIEVISFDNYVYLQQSFSSSEQALKTAIENILENGGTALFDGIYAGLYQTNLESGSKCVIAFTDGMENASSYTFDDVVNMAKNTGIPVFIVGIGTSYEIDESQLQSLATQCSGKYYSANDTDLESILEDIYISIYKEQQDYYVVKYKTSNTEDKDKFREVVLQTSEVSEFTGYYKKSNIPETDVSGAFSSDDSTKDFMLDFSSNREVERSDLDGMSLAQLRIARNEIFARHGRQFNDPLLNQWFYSKTWYLNIPVKYSPNDFDKNNPNPLSKLERSNAEFIMSFEKEKMESEDIYPDAANEQLTEYDLALSKPVLKTALSQMKGYSSSSTLNDNIKKVQEEINKEDVQY